MSEVLKKRIMTHIYLSVVTHIPVSIETHAPVSKRVTAYSECEGIVMYELGRTETNRDPYITESCHAHTCLYRDTHTCLYVRHWVQQK